MCRHARRTAGGVDVAGSAAGGCRRDLCPLLVGLTVAGPQDDPGAVGGAGRVGVEAQSGLRACDGAVGVDGPLLVGLAVAVPDDDGGAVGGAASVGVQALRAVHGRLVRRGVGPRLVGRSGAVVELSLHAVGGAGVRDVEAASGLAADDAGRGGDDGGGCGAGGGGDGHAGEDQGQRGGRDEAAAETVGQRRSGVGHGGSPVFGGRVTPGLVERGGLSGSRRLRSGKRTAAVAGGAGGSSRERWTVQLVRAGPVLSRKAMGGARSRWRGGLMGLAIRSRRRSTVCAPLIRPLTPGHRRLESVRGPK